MRTPGTYKKGHKHSEETKRKIGEATRGRVGYWKGKTRPPFSAETRKKISDAIIGIKRSEETRCKISEFQKNRKRLPLSDETKAKISKAHIGMKHTEETCRKMSENNRGKRCGENNPSWKGGLTSDNRRARNSIEFKEWRESVFEQDDYTCQKCDKRGVFLHPHHIMEFAKFKELRFKIENGITLCVPCHQGIHWKNRKAINAGR